ncbi:MAG: diacylglycerol kinase family lipid kinase [Candidatus Aegiribacteria sp.]|nr:diacylglycerol kinase family lipid kinase [Candidatus Aegiribacteria sp.]
MDPISEFKISEIRPASDNSSWLILVNPEAGHGISGKDLADISSLFEASNIQHAVFVTESYRQLFDNASTAAKMGYKGIVACGGDGTVSQIAAGIIQGKTRIPLSVLPSGNGNDWARTAGIGSFDDTVESILQDDSCAMDAAECVIMDKNGDIIHSSVFINSAGIGLDAHVLQKAIKLRKKLSLGKLGYIFALVSTVLEMPFWRGRMIVDGSEVYSGRYLSLTSGVCPYVGGGMMLSPSSTPFDDMLDTAMVRPISRIRLIRSVPMIYRGSILKNPAVSSWRGTEFILEAEGRITIELDGESIPQIPDNSTVILKSIPSAIWAVGAGPDI